ncbi:(2,3-dihydroxybenzoyl)adenylate synthase [Tsukamurella paurometabola]|uniref:(2,3-dihydroxybenzoyl)adenylate synthase n=1 Tax=Tsukamurella paurometabola TaxID=2061 RepID=UPI00019F07AF|nr:AMP-binding protein [Tsukamurella paurometabola]
MTFVSPSAADFVNLPPQQRRRYVEARLYEGLPLWSAILGTGRTDPSLPAVLDEERSLTRAELDSASAARAAGFAGEFAPGDVVVLHLPNTVEFVVTLLGLLRAGVLPVMALPAHRIAEIEHLAATSGAVGYICADDRTGYDYRDLGTELRGRVPAVRSVLVDGAPGPHRALVDGAPSDSPDVRPDPTTPALFLISGGTTGAPKLIPRTHEDYLYNARTAAAVCGLGPDDVYLVALPAAHNFPLACPGLIGALLTGGRVVLTRDPSPDSALELIEQHRVTVTALVPALAQLWTAARAWESADVTSLRLLQVGGAKLAEPDARAAQEAFPGTLQQVFGMAEGLINLTRIGADPDVVATTQGIPMSPFDELRVVDEDGEDVPEGTVGELLTRGPYTIRGYYRAGAANRRAFTSDGFYRSGDQVRIRPDGSIEYVSRIKETIVRGGENIFPDDIEEALLAHPAVREAGVIGLPDPVLGERTCAVLVTDGRLLTLAEVRDHLTGRGLAAFKLPDRVRVIDDLPLTAVGKVDKKALRGLLR